MADTKPETKPILDWKSAEQYLTDVKNKVFEYAGKSGYNPYIWWKDKAANIEQAFNDGARTDDLHKSIMSLKFEPPVAYHGTGAKKHPVPVVKEKI